MLLLTYDIFIYVFFACFASMLARKSERYIVSRHLSVNVWDQYLICFMLFFTLIGGIRWNVGVDNFGYIRAFLNPKDVEDSREPLYVLVVALIHNLGLHWSIGIGVWSFVQIFFITKVLKPYRYLLVLMPFVFFGGRYWLDAMNVMRQMMVASAFLWASKFICEKKIIKYILFIACATLIHKSVLILIPFYFFPTKLKIYQHRVVLILIIISCLIIGQSPAFERLGQYVGFFQIAIGYDNYGNSVTNILTNGINDALSFGPMMLTYLLIPIFIIWYSPIIIKKYSHEIPYLNFWYNLSYFYSCVFFLVCNINQIFLRPITYFLLFQMLMATLVLYYLLHEVKHRKRQFSFLMYCIIIFLNIGWNVIKSSGKSPLEETTTYKVFFMHEIDSKRLRLE